MRRFNLRAGGLSMLALAAAVPLLTASPVAAQQSPVPFDSQRGVFTFATGLERALPAVVQVTTLGQSEGPSSGDNEPRPMASGSGAIIDAREGIVVTNNHVVEGGRKFTVDMTDGRIFDAVLIGTDKATDLAVLKIEATGLSQIEVVNSDSLRTGDLAFAVGYPLGLDQTLTMGVISGMGRSGMGDRIEDYIQTDAAVNSGNSGGPLLDSRGRLIGINTSILSGGGGGNDGIAFAVPSRILMYVVAQLRETGEVKRGTTGVILGSLNPERSRDFGLGIVRGAVIEDIAPGSSAERGGLRRGDVITRIQNRPVSNAGTVAATVGIAPPGTRIEVVYLRDGHEGRTTIPVEAPTDLPVILGADAVIARGAATRLDSEGLQVFSVEGGSVAAAADLRAGDMIRSVDGQAITDLAALAQAMGGTGERTLSVARGEETIEIRLP
jgi:serine protease DegQ